MMHERFPTSTELLELLLAFEKKDSLEGLASIIGKDPSVVSRNLQRLSDEIPVLQKANRKWEITDLGRKVNFLSRQYLSELEKAIGTSDRLKIDRSDKLRFGNACLLIINAQKGLLYQSTRQRNNTEAETNARALLGNFRSRRKPIIHIKHVSENHSSRFQRDTEGSEFVLTLAPEESESVIEKSKASAFSGTPLFEKLQQCSIDTVILTGFTANECIDATARDACELGFKVIVASDATATFDLIGPDGKVYKADRVHRLVLTNLRALYAQVLSSSDLLKLLQ
jgi:nicotinamidase-related amidase